MVGQKSVTIKLLKKFTNAEQVELVDHDAPEIVSQSLPFSQRCLPCRKEKNHAESPTKHASVAAYATCRFAVNILSLLIMRVMSVCDSQSVSNGDE